MRGCGMNDTRMRNRTVASMTALEESITDVAVLAAKPKPDWDEIFALSKKIARIAGDYEWELGKAMSGIG